jgi:riboflavin kinase
MHLAKTAPIEALIQLAKEGAQRGAVKISLNWLADRSGISRQTAARRLAELEDQSLIERTMEPRGQSVRITPAGLAVLRAFHQELGSIIKPTPRSMVLSGRIVAGVGEGSYYMSQTHYIEQFEKEAGFVPYPGTLDIKLDKDSVGLKEVIARLPSKEVSGFETKERAFGPVRFFPARLRKSRVALILPLRSHYTDVIELIAPQNLRRSLGLKDGDPVQVEVIV